MCGSNGADMRGSHCGCRGPRHEGFLEAWLLLLLRVSPSHGYELLERLGQATGQGVVPDPGTLYRNLRRMEDEGLVTSSWDFSAAGPPRRLYRVTEQGEELLHGWAAEVEHYRFRLDRFLSMYADLTGRTRA
ncbi:MAG: helix-turn-helix transcriptional regulator [Bacillota bacterium]|nr:helix-turn-helix transcriptional regulator [Bacillota bacterium]